MKYGERAFDVLYLFFAIISGVVILVRAKDRSGRLTGSAALQTAEGEVQQSVT